MHTVLIAEDDRVLQKVLGNKLGKYRGHFNLIFADDGQAAIAVMKKTPVSLVVTDIQMPRVDGFHLLAYMSEHHPVVPCFVMTSHDPQKTRHQVAEESVYFFPKPIDAEALGRGILQVLERDIPKGAVYGISVTAFLQMIAMEKKTCLFDVTLDDGRKGRFYFNKGILYDAVCGNLRHEAAALALITTEAARFRFKYVPPQKTKRRILADLLKLIMEAKRRELGLSPVKVAG